MDNKVNICVALSGGATRKGEGKGFSPYVPISVDEVAEETKRCYDAGATMVHIHARDPVTQLTYTGDQAEENIKCFAEMTEKIRAKCPIIINITTGGGFGQSLDSKLDVVRRLKPEIASFTSGTLIHAIFSKSNNDWVMDHKGGVSFREMQKAAEVFRETGTKPELEIYSFAQLNNIKMLEKEFQFPLQIQLVMGMPGQVTPATPMNVFYGFQIARDTFGEGNFTWSVCAAGIEQWKCITTGACLGAQTIRVGLEDNLYLEPGVQGSNAQMVEKAVALARGVGREISNVEEARASLNLK